MTKFRTGRRAGVMAFLTICFFSAAAQNNEEALEEFRTFWARQEAIFRDSAQTPLLAADREKFQHLECFPFNLEYRVRARFVRNHHPVLFGMKTTTARLPEYIKYGHVEFSLDGRQLSLEVYQSPDIIRRPGYEDYLFIPFTDQTNGDETYDVGRYLEMRIPEADSVTLDFNVAYNPYCSYNPKYSCPIPPAANHLDLSVKAGEKKFTRAGME